MLHEWIQTFQLSITKEEGACYRLEIRSGVAVNLELETKEESINAL